MTKKQMYYFRKKLESWKLNIETEMQEELELELKNELLNLEDADEGDVIDKRNIIDFQEKRKNYYNKILNEIKYALKKIEENTFGICEETGEEINFKRLDANPIARFSLEAQSVRENY
ncbi:TraR/DksA C4-type zinc finger protein [Alphaproteobacteria bacterium endosymbiont of Tiliacea citrago]|uniref:TraR/DksA family transcriptional regulator n=1 Tax=Alphaproteobacteria bacterium endosymbiont of Tiliacea citrago TaxID=3077944 RepID=UPI00313ECD2D